MARINFLCDRNKHIIVYRDVKFSKIVWKHLNDDPSGGTFMEYMINSYLEQHVEVPARNNNLLDLILLRTSVSKESIKFASPITNSDHDPVNFEIRVSE